MIRLSCILALCLWTSMISGQPAKHREFLPPYNFQVDSVSLLASWEAPKIVLLQEDFENLSSFPPSGWSTNSLGKGWTGVESPDFRYWVVPEHPDIYALANDDSATYSNDGSMDYLITPIMDLTVADSFQLGFDSYFDGAYGQRAYLEYSIDNGLTWHLLRQIDADLEWQRLEVDLSQFSGPEGNPVFQLAFHSDDNGVWASGYAVDNIIVSSDKNPLELIGYKIYLDNMYVDQVTATFYQFQCMYYTSHTFTVYACYQDGMSEPVQQDLISYYLTKPDSLLGYAPDDAAVLQWYPPIVQGTIPFNLIGFNLYRSGNYLAYVDYIHPDSCHYIDPIDFSYSSNFSYEVTALYDMAAYGFPGDTGESLKEGPAEITSCCWNELDFFEDWDIWSHNYWKFAGHGWSIDPGFGNEEPSAVFRPDSVLDQYERSLETWQIVDWNTIEDIILEYDVSLSSLYPSGNEKLLVQVYDYRNDSWNTVNTRDNSAGSFGWQRDTINITSAFNDNAFKIRFTARGENSADISYWAVDNISVRREFYPPENVNANFINYSEDSVLVTWSDPMDDLAEWREWDDGVLANKLGFGSGKNDWASCAVRWSPEQLAGLKGANLTAIGFIPGEGSAFFKIAIWTGENKDLVYLQAAGNLIVDQWNIIPLNVPFKVDITKDLLVGYKLAEYMGYPMTADDGPAIDGFSNLTQFQPDQEWQTLLQVNPNFDWNWNIKAWFERDGYPAGSYRLYRSLDGGTIELTGETEALEFTDTIHSAYTSSCYKLKSVINDEFESDFSEEACVLVTSADPVELKNNEDLNIFPNPASESISVTSSEIIDIISIYNSFGELMLKKKVDEKQIEIPVAAYPAGIYLIKVELGSRVISKKVMVVH